MLSTSSFREQVDMKTWNIFQKGWKKSRASHVDNNRVRRTHTQTHIHTHVLCNNTMSDWTIENFVESVLAVPWQPSGGAGIHQDWIMCMCMCVCVCVCVCSPLIWTWHSERTGICLHPEAVRACASPSPAGARPLWPLNFADALVDGDGRSITSWRQHIVAVWSVTRDKPAALRSLADSSAGISNIPTS